MPRLILFIFCLFISTLVNAQQDELLGKWILVRTLKQNNQRLEINNPYYSRKQIFQVLPKKIKIDGYTFPTKFKNNIIELNDSRYKDLEYKIQENYLIAKEINGEFTHFYLKVDDFIKRFPEFELKEEMRNGKKVLIDNGLSAYDFDHELPYIMFILLNGSGSSEKIDVKPNDMPLRFEYTLTKDNKVENLNILESTNEKLDQDYLSRFKKATRYLKNNTDADVLISYKGITTITYPQLTDQQEKKLFELSAEVDKYYHKNQFKKVTELYPNSLDLKIKQYKFDKFIDENNIKFGIAFLATGNIDQACEAFNRVGDITDFRVRNYLLDFCIKN